MTPIPRPLGAAFGAVGGGASILILGIQNFWVSVGWAALGCIITYAIGSLTYRIVRRH
jgi:hypothetical protein